jgi:enoyl-CoA hydratase/carnithine racemase
MPEPLVLVERRQEGCVELVLNRPSAMNALNLALVEALRAELAAQARDPGVRGLILRGAGERAFVAGADIGELRTRRREEALLGINARLFQEVEDFPHPVIAAIRGYALGGGCELALACDIRIGATDAVLGQPEVKLGIIPGAGGPHRLSRTVGPGMARELIFTGRTVAAEEALRIGLLNRVVPVERLLEEARALMASIQANGALAVRLAKLALNAAANSVDRRHQMLELLAQGILFETAEKEERMTRFLERKKG